MTDRDPAHLRLFLARFLAVRQDGTGWTAKCPAHEDDRNSLHVALGDDGRILLHCHAGCQLEAILGAIGVRPSALFPGRRGSAAAPAAGAPPRVLESRYGFDESSIAATYNYLDEDGGLLLQVLRDRAKNFRQRRPTNLEPPEPAWAYDVRTVKKVVYRLPEIRSAVALQAAGKLPQPIFVVEGEKDADSLAALGLVATTNPGGAGKWTEDHASLLAGAADVVVIPDNDDAGRKHARQVVSSLRSKVGRVRTLQLPGLQAKGDASDWIAAGGTRDELLALCAAPSPLPPGWTNAAELIERDAPDVDWLVENLIARDGIAILSGESSVFKSWTTLSLVLGLGTGTRFVDRFDCPESRVMMVNADEEEAETRRKLKFLAAGGRLENGSVEKIRRNVAIRSGDVFLGSALPRRPRDDDDLADLDELADAVAGFRPDLVVIDSASAVIEGDMDKREFARAAKRIVSAIREVRPVCAVLFVHEWNKPSRDGGKRAGDRLKGTGSLRYLITHHFALECSVQDVVTFRVDKQRRGRKIPPFDFLVRIVESEGLAVLEYHGDARDRRGETGSVKAVIEWLTAHPGRHAQADVVRALSSDFSDRSVKEAIWTLESMKPPRIGTDRLHKRRTVVWALGTAPEQEELGPAQEGPNGADEGHVGKRKSSRRNQSLPPDNRLPPTDLQ